MAQLIGNAMSCNVIVKLFSEISDCIGFAAGISAPSWCADPGADPMQPTSVVSLALRKGAKEDIERCIDGALSFDKREELIFGATSRALNRNGWKLLSVFRAKAFEPTCGGVFAICPHPNRSAEIMSEGHLQILKSGFIHVLNPCPKVACLEGMIIIRVTPCSPKR
jgi:hypothetical protein